MLSLIIILMINKARVIYIWTKQNIITKHSTLFLKGIYSKVFRNLKKCARIVLPTLASIRYTLPDNERTLWENTGKLIHVFAARS